MENNPYARPESQAPMPRPDSYLVWAILSTILCCLPFGIVSIVYAAKVDSLYAAGNYREAQAASTNARKWAIISAVTGFVTGFAVSVIYGIAFLVSAASQLHL